MEKYFKKRKLDMMIDSFRIWYRMLEMRKKNLDKATTDEVNHEMTKRWEMFLSQAIITQMKAIDVIKAWELEVTKHELEKLKQLVIEDEEDISYFIEFLKYLHDQLSERHKVLELNTRLLFFPITKGESIVVLLALVSLQVVF